ncbi:MAG TPA: glycosyltransferase family 2 protein [Paracoccus sp. (in: a-proteobacteria)]|uniref:glycosyltransferase family 2 protein n=1 Tax=uncultured Paracoccus sp. TaxID=189685 RepID=UPI00262F4EF3|nr:glycosyltransferase family 2 protein [uncultured Paracoccus sp.]HMQ40395.1 glycosyltransferase family 2 protein [Paracoccus sp. (in: a-proteobacteria)]HMR35010.1 glycosyltransferase family 2 protein [Paracoccus sp. (in: a-proteobacteria)]
MALKRHVSPHGTVMAVSMMKDEAPYLLEWFAHHLAVGFTDILVYTNDCTDGTVEMLQRLEELGLGYHRPNDIPEGMKPQPSALNYAQDEPLVQAADWVMIFDADEFLSVNHPSGHLDGMLDDAVAQGANGIIVTWRIFGSGGVVDWSRDPVTEQYTRAAPPLWNKGWGVKTLFKFDPEYWKLGIHRPSIKNKHLKDGFPDTVKWLNGSGRPMEDYFKFRGWRTIRRTLGYDWAQMNHYAVKSIDSYAVRRFRGNVNNKKDKYNADYWSLQDRNEVADTRILRHAPRRAEIMAELLQDPVLSKLHYAALERVEARLEEYRGSEAYQALRDSLIEAGKVPITSVEAKPPQARDPAKIAALMSEVERKSSEKPDDARKDAPVSGWNAMGAALYRSGRIRLSPGDAVEWVESQRVALPCDPQLFTEEASMAVLAGKFDRRHARNIASYLAGGRRVLDLGAGIGLPAMTMLRAQDGITLMVQDSQPGIAEAAARIRARNGLEDTARLRFVDGPLVLPGDEGAAAGGLAAYLGDFRPDILRISTRADLVGQHLDGIDLSRLIRVVLPFDSPEEADGLRQSFGPVLEGRGFVERVEAADSGSLRYDRLAEKN